ncbi:integral membrane protein [Diplocarpon rosae]|nr:integral membrane protein [Diplocarpon rosae]
MSEPASTPSLPSSTTENPIAAVRRKVRSALGSGQQPSIRIQRGHADLREAANEDATEKPTTHDATTPHQTFLARFRKMFSNDEDHVADHSAASRDEYDNSMVDILDVIDPEVAALSTLTNVQNSLFVPSLGKILNRRPTYRISESPEDVRTLDKVKNMLRMLKIPLTRNKSSASVQMKLQYAVLPEGERLGGWADAEKEELDDMVRHQLHSKRAKFKRGLKGFKQYVRRPLGLFITVYATLITLFGAAWVLFLIGWISLGSKQSYIVNVVDNVLVALFAIIGDGLAPFRVVDTYHMIYIAHYHQVSWNVRKKLDLPELIDPNDLPERREEDMAHAHAHVDIESLVAKKVPRGLARKVVPMIPKSYAQKMVARSKARDPAFEYSVLTGEQQAKLEYHERKFSKSHTFYKPHETETHYAFPLKLLIAVVLLLDLHSCLQITLGACTWAINYKTRPFALTTVILCCSITANITAGILISKGDKQTRKHEVIERMMRQELTAEALEEITKRRMKEAEERGEIDPAVRRRMEEEKDRRENEEIKKSWKDVPLLPKTLLGKGVDNRQPSLPQEARRSSSNASAAAAGKDPNALSRKSLPAVEEVPATPKTLTTKSEGPEQTRGQKVMGFIRKADLDRS